MRADLAGRLEKIQGFGEELEQLQAEQTTVDPALFGDDKAALLQHQLIESLIGQVAQADRSINLLMHHQVTTDINLIDLAKRVEQLEAWAASQGPG